MTPTIVSLLAVTVGFLALVIWVYWPSRKADVERHGSIPLQDGSPRSAAQQNPQKERSK